MNIITVNSWKTALDKHNKTTVYYRCGSCGNTQTPIEQRYCTTCGNDLWCTVSYSDNTGDKK